MAENSPADHQILAILAELQEALGEATKLEAGEVDKIREILRHGETLVRIARYEEAKGLFWAHWRSLILGGAALLSALLLFWNNAEKMGVKLWRFFQ